MKIISVLFAMLLSPAIAMAGNALQPTLVLQASGSVSASAPGRVEAEDDAQNGMAFYALSLSGTPYKYGGNSPDTGFDCSGFVEHVFRHSLGISLPRGTSEIWRAGQEIGADQLRPGDLVFFDTLKRMFSHVGIYLGDDRFVHSPSNGGSIRVDNISEDYWRQRFNGARRITLSR